MAKSFRVLLLAVLAFGCSEKATSTSPPSESASKVTPKETPKAAAIAFEVDGKALSEVPRLSPDQPLLELGELPPLGEWTTIVALSRDGREFRGAKPEKLAGERTMKLVAMPDGTTNFRVMEPGKDGSPSIRHEMPDITSVQIFTKSYVPPKRQRSSLHIVQGGDRFDVSGMLERFETTAEPGKEEARSTWNLTTIFHGDELASPNAVLTLRSKRGEEVSLTAADLLREGTLHLLKRNQRDQYHYRQWRIGEAPKQLRELRDLSEMEVLP